MVTHPLDVCVVDFAISRFSQADLAASAVMYVHSSEAELYIDNFIFSVSDGTNNVSRPLAGNNHCLGCQLVISCSLSARNLTK